MPSGRDRAIVAEYVAGKSAPEVGRLYGISGARVYQILKRAGEPRRKWVPPLRLHLVLGKKRSA